MQTIKTHITRQRTKHLLFAAIKAFFFISILFFLFPLERVHFAALGSSSFAAFAIPKEANGQTQNLLLSYVISILIGILGYYLIYLSFGIINFPYFIILISGITVAVTMFTQTMLNIEHPPSAGIALGFILDAWTWETPLAIVIAISFLVLFRASLNWIHSKRIKNKVHSHSGKKTNKRD